MGAFIYYLPGIDRRFLEAGDLVSAGLGHLKGARVESRGLLGNGPDGRAMGVLVRATFGGQQPATALEYHPETQTWGEAVDGKAWVGYERDDPPRPVDLLRPDGPKGHPVELYGGDRWMVPAARNVSGAWLLPQRIRMTVKGELRYEPCPEHADLAEGMEAAWRYLTGTESLPYATAMRLCAGLLGLNYAMGLPELSLLGLITTHNLLDVCAAAGDMPALRETIRAMEEDQAESRPFVILDGGSSADGSTDSLRDTSQPGATSPCTRDSIEGVEQ